MISLKQRSFLTMVVQISIVFSLNAVDEIWPQISHSRNICIDIAVLFYTNSCLEHKSALAKYGFIVALNF